MGRTAIRPFVPKTFKTGEQVDYSQRKEIYGGLASTDENHNIHFALHPDSKKYLGIDQQEKAHLESLISQEVEARVSAIQEEARREGYARGMAEGKIESERKMIEKFDPIWTQFKNLTEHFDRMKEEVYKANERVLIQFLYYISKHLVLRELKTDREYVKRLCMTLIERIGVRDHIKIKISRADQDNIEETKEFLKAQYADLKNIHIEISDELQLGGVKVETNLIKVNASLETQLHAVEESLK